ncbi:myosin-VI [Capsaspora owczarzaki ATCC 30864]|uniref:Myosin-VI n=1 Tax=Capsaspora owczarzaki (strain ATCC 30864) TaxID=595528 RepID=A0A0D2VRV5_CAPO3|nr:myosin-VI [Capsaspora owczarzaki ATCC 30864]KJE93657.1 myosin-VI [Capsaspora owczarzaki ATCC 30864]|eukprot:XP_004348242.2 myosin-VI [Capsaspora owczarzaki ATCC 30864]
MEGKRVWAPNTNEGYELCDIVDFAVETITAQPVSGGGAAREVSYDRVFPADDADNNDVDDNCALMFLNEASLLHNLRKRYAKGAIYTYTANILIAVNPYASLPIYDGKSIERYRGKSLGVEPPHVFAIADKAYRDMKASKTSQSVIVSGESGAGKTESTKYIIRYLTDSLSSSGDLEQRILQANPILESFGNAKTTRNYNSSRFGKFVEIHFDSKSTVSGAYISHYLLEKSRIVSQASEERNYHIFYQMCHGAPADMAGALGLSTPDKFRYLKSGTTTPLKGLDDKGDFLKLTTAMGLIGMSQEEQVNIFKTVGAVLQLGNIDFEESTKDNKGGSEVAGSSITVATAVANLLGVNVDDLKEKLCSRVMSTTRGGAMGTIYKVPLKTGEASSARDAMAKTIYSRLFDWIVARVNKCFPFSESVNYIGVLDIAGFEFFQHNSFEQFCINFCNEKLQQFFNEKVLKQEQEIYAKEGITYREIEYLDNQDVIDMIEDKKEGILAALDEEAKLPTPLDKHFSQTLHNKFKKHFRFVSPKKSKVPSQKKLTDDEAFMIRHYAGAVCYEVVGFVDKNNDALHADLEMLLDETKDAFIKELFSKPASAEGDAKDSGKDNGKRAKLHFESVGKKFSSQLTELMDKLRATRSNFVRCIKPNLKMLPNIFSGAEILSQLQCAGMVEVLTLLQGGYPSRTAFSDLYEMYKGFLPAKLSSLDPRTFCQALFKALGMDETHFQFGMSKVFFKSGKFAEFDKMTKADPENLKALIETVTRWLVRKRWRKVIFGVLSTIKLQRKITYRGNAALLVQSVIRRFNAQNKIRPRIRARRELLAIQEHLKIVNDIISKLKKDGDKFTKKLKPVEDSIEEVSKGLWTIDPKTIFAKLKDANDEIARQLTELKSKKKEQEEEERLRKLAEEMEKERLRKEEEERKRRELEEELRKKAELEAARKKAEEEERKRQEELRKQREAEAANKKLQEKLEKERQEELQRKQQEEQEKRDLELAVRVAEDTSQGKDVLEDARKEEEKRQKEAAKGKEKKKGKHDLSKWKYAELRDTINTSVDLELLEACREEFHRRLKVYHAWKMKHMKKNMATNAATSGPGGAQAAEVVAEEDQRAPSEVLENAAEINDTGAPPPPPRTASKAENREQRYFKIPFIRPSDQNAANKAKMYKKKGWWYAHFDGQWIARQLEWHPEKDPVLLLAGRDDLEMCELSLEETGLCRKRGAEILVEEFDEAWTKYGGEPWTPAWKEKAAKSKKK